MAAAIMRDAAIAVRGEEKHLVLEGVGAERPAVAEDDWLSAAPVLVVNLCSVLGGDGRHGDLPWARRPRLFHSMEGDLVPFRHTGLAGFAAICSFLRQAVAARLTSGRKPDADRGGAALSLATLGNSAGSAARSRKLFHARSLDRRAPPAFACTCGQARRWTLIPSNGKVIHDEEIRFHKTVMLVAALAIGSPASPAMRLLAAAGWAAGAEALAAAAAWAAGAVMAAAALAAARRWRLRWPCRWRLRRPWHRPYGRRRVCRRHFHGGRFGHDGSDHGRRFAVGPFLGDNDYGYGSDCWTNRGAFTPVPAGLNK